MKNKTNFFELNTFERTLVLIGLSIKGCYIKISDKVFLHFHKDYDPIDSIEGRKRIRQAIEKYYDVQIIKLSYQLLYYDEDFMLELLSQNIYTDDEIDKAIGLMDYCKETVKVR